MSYIGKGLEYLAPFVYEAVSDGVTLTHTLPWPAETAYSLLVFADGVNQAPTVDYTVSGYTLSLTSALPIGVQLRVYGITISGVCNTVAAGSITSDKLGSPVLQSLGSLVLSADKLLYSTGATTFALTPFTSYARTFLETPDVATLRTNIGTVSLSTDETITGTKTFASRPIVPRIPITYISKTGYNSCFMIRGGKLYSTAGNNGSYTNSATGRGAAGTLAFFGVDQFKEVPIPSASPVVKAGSTDGYAAAWALLQDGSLYVWGVNGTGQLGLGNTTATTVPTLSTTNVVDVYTHPSNGNYSVSQSRLFIKKTDGYIYGAGYNAAGGLGLGNTTNPISSWSQITSLGTNVVRFFNLGSTYGCFFAQKDDDSIWAAGYNGQGMLGDGTTVNKTTAVDVTTQWQGGAGWVIEKMGGGFGYYDTAANASSTVVMLLRNTSTQATKVLTCGANGWGSIGDGTSTARSTPYLIPNSNSVQDMATMGGGPCSVHMLNTDGALYAWGYNNQGQLGVNSTVNTTSPTLAVTNVSAILSDGITSNLYSYRSQAFIKNVDGTIYSTGYNASGHLGVGDSTNRQVFTQVILPGGIDVIDMGWFSTAESSRIFLLRTADHRLYGWGYNGHYGVTESNTANVIIPTSCAFSD